MAKQNFEIWANLQGLKITNLDTGYVLPYMSYPSFWGMVKDTDLSGSNIYPTNSLLSEIEAQKLTDKLSKQIRKNGYFFEAKINYIEPTNEVCFLPEYERCSTLKIVKKL